MATVMCANLEMRAGHLVLQSLFLRPREPTPTSRLAVVPAWKSKSVRELRTDGHFKGGSGKATGFSAAYRDLDSEPRREELLCCPICFKPLSRDGPAGLTQTAIKASGFSCKSCRKVFVNKDVYLDLTILEGNKVYDENSTIGVEMFRTPLVSFLYERGWRSSPLWADFPGPDEEFRMAQEYFTPVVGSALIDVSCGSGLFTRRFARSQDYSSVIALDFSENMLRETDRFIKEDASLATSNIALVRADVARLPFATGSIDAVHAGAAIHCWPSAAAGVAEISRILKPGGIVVGSTFLQPLPIIDFGSRDVRKTIKGVMNSTTVVRFFEESDLEEVCGICGLVEYSCIRRGGYIMFSAKRAQGI